MKRGYEKKLLFSHNRCIYNDFETQRTSEFEASKQAHIDRFLYFSDSLLPAFEALGGAKEQCDVFTKDNA